MTPRDRFLIPINGDNVVHIHLRRSFRRQSGEGLHIHRFGDIHDRHPLLHLRRGEGGESFPLLRIDIYDTE